MSPYGVYEQRVFFQRFARMQDSTSLIIIDIRHADNEFEALFFGYRHKGIGKTEGRAFRVIFFSVIEHVKLRCRDFFQAPEITVARVLNALIEARGILQKSQRHIRVYFLRINR